MIAKPRTPACMRTNVTLACTMQRGSALSWRCLDRPSHQSGRQLRGAHVGWQWLDPTKRRQAFGGLPAWSSKGFMRKPDAEYMAAWEYANASYSHAHLGLKGRRGDSGGDRRRGELRSLCLRYHSPHPQAGQAPHECRAELLHVIWTILEDPALPPLSLQPQAPAPPQLRSYSPWPALAVSWLKPVLPGANPLSIHGLNNSARAEGRRNRCTVHGEERGRVAGQK